MAEGTVRLASFPPILYSLACLLACQGAGGSAGISGSPTPLTLTRFRTDSVAFAQYSGMTAAQNLVVRDAAAWNNLWQRIHAGLIPLPPRPDVDFSQDMVVAAAMGTRSTGGYDVLLTGASEDGGGVEIRALEVSPGAQCGVTTALTQPVDLARMPRRDEPVRFVVSQQVRSCGP